jgi:hypothetical protein
MPEYFIYDKDGGKLTKVDKPKEGTLQVSVDGLPATMQLGTTADVPAALKLQIDRALGKRWAAFSMACFKLSGEDPALYERVNALLKADATSRDIGRIMVERFSRQGADSFDDIRLALDECSQGRPQYGALIAQAGDRLGHARDHFASFHSEGKYEHAELLLRVARQDPGHTDVSAIVLEDASTQPGNVTAALDAIRKGPVADLEGMLEALTKPAVMGPDGTAASDGTGGQSPAETQAQHVWDRILSKFGPGDKKEEATNLLVQHETIADDTWDLIDVSLDKFPTGISDDFKFAFLGHLVENSNRVPQLVGENGRNVEEAMSFCNLHHLPLEASNAQRQEAYSPILMADPDVFLRFIGRKKEISALQNQFERTQAARYTANILRCGIPDIMLEPERIRRGWRVLTALQATGREGSEDMFPAVFLCGADEFALATSEEAAKTAANLKVEARKFDDLEPLFLSALVARPCLLGNAVDGNHSILALANRTKQVRFGDDTIAGRPIMEEYFAEAADDGGMAARLASPETIGNTIGLLDNPDWWKTLNPVMILTPGLMCDTPSRQNGRLERLADDKIDPASRKVGTSDEDDDERVQAKSRPSRPGRRRTEPARFKVHGYWANNPAVRLGGIQWSEDNEAERYFAAADDTFLKRRWDTALKSLPYQQQLMLTALSNMEPQEGKIEETPSVLSCTRDRLYELMSQHPVVGWIYSLNEEGARGRDFFEQDLQQLQGAGHAKLTKDIVGLSPLLENIKGGESGVELDVDQRSSLRRAIRRMTGGKDTDTFIEALVSDTIGRSQFICDSAVVKREKGTIFAGRIKEDKNAEKIVSYLEDRGWLIKIDETKGGQQSQTQYLVNPHVLRRLGVPCPRSYLADFSNVLDTKRITDALYQRRKTQGADSYDNWGPALPDDFAMRSAVQVVLTQGEPASLNQEREDEAVAILKVLSRLSWDLRHGAKREHVLQAAQKAQDSKHLKTMQPGPLADLLPDMFKAGILERPALGYWCLAADLRKKRQTRRKDDLAQLSAETRLNDNIDADLLEERLKRLKQPKQDQAREMAAVMSNLDTHMELAARQPDIAAILWASGRDISYGRITTVLDDLSKDVDMQAQMAAGAERHVGAKAKRLVEKVKRGNEVVYRLKVPGSGDVVIARDGQDAGRMQKIEAVGQIVAWCNGDLDDADEVRARILLRQQILLAKGKGKTDEADAAKRYAAAIEADARVTRKDVEQALAVKDREYMRQAGLLAKAGVAGFDASNAAKAVNIIRGLKVSIE